MSEGTLETLTVKGFKQIRKMRINFTKGVNVIVGPTGSGKSATLKSLKWNLRNIPHGDTVFSKHGTDIAEVETIFDTGEILRIKNRSGSVNTYVIEDEPLKAGTNVPEAVSEISRMDQDNFWEQFDGHFLIDDSPGVVATRLNEVSGLGIIDTYMDKIDRIIRNTNSKIGHTEEDLELKQAQIKSLEGFEDEILVVNKLLEESKEIDLEVSKAEEIEASLVELNDYHEKIQKANKALKEKGNVKLLLKEMQIIVAEERTAEELNDLLDQWDEIEESKEKFKLIDIEKELADVSTLIEDAEVLNLLIKDYETVSEYLEDYVNVSKNISLVSTRIEILKKERDKIRSELQFCPICGSEFK